MYLLLGFIFFVSLSIIVWAMVGYPVALLVLDRILGKDPLPKNYESIPTVTLMIVAHNEEKVIEEKLLNVLNVDYPPDKMEILVSSDNSTDCTNDRVKRFIADHINRKIRLYEVKERKGKTNAQNEAAKTVAGEILIMTDANAMLDKNAVRELVASFYQDNIAYVTGRLCYINAGQEWTSGAENSYWDIEMKLRDIESRLQTITAGNGALYACKTKDYYDFDPILCHDSAMPLYFGLLGKRAICNHAALAFEKASEDIEDEFGRKVRMNRQILKAILPDLRILNIFKYRWFTFFYVGHRTCRYLLWIAQLLVFVSNMLLMAQSWFYVLAFAIQGLVYLLALVRVVTKADNKVLNIIYYYLMTVSAQWAGVVNMLSGRAKPTWEKAESTR